MKNSKYLIILFFGLTLQTLTGCRAQNTSKKNLYVKDLKFESVFGYNPEQKKTIYCVLGQGFFKTPSSENSDSLLQGWLTKHPNANIIKISSLLVAKNSEFIYCWIIDGTDTLNNYLIKQGCYPGGTMQRPQTLEEMSDEEKTLYKDIEKPEVKIYIDKNVYDNFIEQIKVAETYAQKNKLGIWLTVENEE